MVDAAPPAPNPRPWPAPDERRKRKRGRPQSFERDKVVQRIQACFAAKGYAGTSLDDLSAATGLARPSLYRAFGDKRSMYLLALELEYQHLVARLQAPNSRQMPLRRRIELFLNSATAAYGVAGCGLALTTAVAGAAKDDAVRGKLQQIITAFGAAAEDLAGERNAPFLTAAACTLCIYTRASLPREALQNTILALLNAGEV